MVAKEAVGLPLMTMSTPDRERAPSSVEKADKRVAAT